jgi:hypothetical protein
MFTSMMAAEARAIPIVRMKRLILSFCSAKTCSTRARIFDFLAFALATGDDIGRPLGFLWWMWLAFPAFSRKASLAAER